MQLQEILSRVDHTLLKKDATWRQVEKACIEAEKYGCASVCIPPAYVEKAAAYVRNAMKICTVVGFPNGYATTQVKVFETEDAIRNGADEIDMMINLGWVREKRWDDLIDEIRAVKASCRGRILKVIVEACMLSQEEKIEMCRVVTTAGADYIKTSSGFDSAGATREDVALFKAHIGPDVRIKAAGGIETLQDAEDLIAQGADRLGSSRLVALAK